MVFKYVAICNDMYFTICLGAKFEIDKLKIEHVNKNESEIVRQIKKQKDSNFCLVVGYYEEFN